MEIGTERWLLFDDYLFASKAGFTTVAGEAARDPEPVLRPEMPWEEGSVWWQNTVLDDAGLIKLYYSAQSADERFRLCLATSTDGVHFERPSLGVVEFEGARDNNIVLEPPPVSRIQGSVFIDPVAPTQERYKAILEGEIMEHDEGVAAYRTIRGAYSADGVRWSHYPEPHIIPWYSDTQNVALWDARLGQYVAYVRYNAGRRVENMRNVGVFHHRCVGRTESEDFRHFHAPEVVLDPDPGDVNVQTNPGWMDLYQGIVMQYPGTRNYVMLPSPFYHYPAANKLDVKLATSRDGIDWTLHDGTFVHLGSAGTWDSERIYMALGMVERGAETWLYYAGFDLDHSGHHKPYPPRFGAIGRARIRRDGFACQQAGAAGGEIVTEPFAVPAERLLLNFDGSAGGCLRVEFLDANGAGIEGFSGEASDLLTGNAVELPTRFGEEHSEDLSALLGRTVRLRLTGRACRLYALQFGGAEGTY